MSDTGVYHGYRQWKQWHELFGYQAHEARLFEREFAGIELQGRQFLDVGFGNGALLAWARDRGAEAAGLEVQAELVAAAQARGFEAWSDAAALPPRRFAVVAAFDVLEHLAESELPAFLAAIRCAMAPEGTLLVRVPNCQSPWGLASQFGDPTHRSMLSGPLVAALLSAAGFRQVSYRNAIHQSSRSGLAAALGVGQALAQRLLLRLGGLIWGMRDVPLAPNVVVLGSIPVQPGEDTAA